MTARNSAPVGGWFCSITWAMPRRLMSTKRSRPKRHTNAAVPPALHSSLPPADPWRRAPAQRMANGEWRFAAVINPIAIYAAHPASLARRNYDAPSQPFLRTVL